MIKGKKSQEYIQIHDLLARTSGGYDIFMFYLGKVHRQMDRPWGRKEKKSSWGVYPFGGTWMWKDQATEESGDAIRFVEKAYGLSFYDAINKISSDFGFTTRGIVKSNVVTWDKPYMDDKEYARFTFTTKPFEERHHSFWNIVEVMEDDLKKLNYFAVKDLAIKGKRVPIKKDEMVFAYFCPEEDAAKIYFPDRDKSERFRNNVSYHHLWHYDQLEHCTNLIVQKSNKDLAVTKMLTPCVISTQAEAVKIFNEEVVGRINDISTSPWIWYGSDWDGVKKCKEITDTNKWRYINTEKKYLPDINDTYGIVKMWNQEKMGTGLKRLQEYMIKKKLII